MSFIIPALHSQPRSSCQIPVAGSCRRVKVPMPLAWSQDVVGRGKVSHVARMSIHGL